MRNSGDQSSDEGLVTPKKVKSRKVCPLLPSLCHFLSLFSRLFLSLSAISPIQFFSSYSQQAIRITLLTSFFVCDTRYLSEEKARKDADVLWYKALVRLHRLT